MNDPSTEGQLLSEGEIPSAEYGLGEGDAPIRRYLLDALTPAERRQVEIRLLTDDEFHEQVGVVEDELIDEYLRGGLSEGERRRLGETLRATPVQRRKLQLAEDLSTYAARKEPVPVEPDPLKKDTGGSWWHALAAFLRFRNPAVGFSLALALLVSVLGGLWQLSKVRRLEGQLALQGEAQRTTASAEEQELRRRLEQQNTRLDELTEERRRAEEQRAKLDDEIAALKSQERPRPPTVPRKSANAAAVAALFLPLIQDRSPGGRTPTLDVPPGAARVRLTLDLDVLNPADYKTFDAEVKEVNGPTVWRGANLSARTSRGGGRVVINPPASVFGAGDYEVKLNGLTRSGQQAPVNTYYFRVRRSVP